MANKIRVTAWNEFRHERSNEYVKSIYPDGIHGLIKQFLETQDDIEVTLASLDDPDNGLPDEVLNNTDVLIWWGHMAHHEVPDALVERIRHRVYTKGMGLIVLHSGHESKIFQRLCGTRCSVQWRESCENGHIWILDPTHPIVQGVSNPIELEAEETYAEPFDVPTPDELIGVTWWKGGEIFRGMSIYKRGRGKIFYFQPGHETNDAFNTPEVQQILRNAAHWAASACRVEEMKCPHILPLEQV